MITIDGSFGEGGGQILRSALGLSMLTGRAFRITKIRANRDKPGLKRQHLTAVRAAKEICSATVEGDAIGSSELSFVPGEVRPGEYRFDIGSAGSATLVLQAVLPALLTAGAPSSLVMVGGTHNPGGPPVDFLTKAFLPIVNRLGPRIDVTLERHGFFPAGGGRFAVHVTPADRLTPIRLDARGRIVGRVATAIVAGLPEAIARRELARVGSVLGWTGDELRVRTVPGDQGPGNALMLEVASEHVTEVFTGIGERGVPAEAVADEPIGQAKSYLDSDAPVGPCLADQLVIPFAMAGGGSYVTLTPTRHTVTNFETVRRFLDVRIACDPLENGTFRASFGGGGGGGA